MQQPPNKAIQASDQYITLQTFLPSVSTANTSGTPAASVMACLLLIMLTVDCLLLLHQVWPFERPLVALLARKGHQPLVLPAILIVQIILLWAGLSFLRSSAIHRQIEPSVRSIITFGLGFDANNRMLLLIEYVVMAALAAGIYWMVAAIPPMRPGVPLPGVILDTIMITALPVVAGWLFTVLIFRSRQDRSIRIGLLLPAVLLSVVSVVSQTNSGPASGAEFQASQIVWFRLIELIFIWSALLSLAYAIISDPANARAFKLIGDNAAAANVLVEYSPFGGAPDPSPKYLMFQLGSAQVLAFTRRYNGSRYEIVNTGDDHAMVPIHDRSIKLWNVTRLLTTLPKQVATTDDQGWFQLTFTLGKLSTTSLAGNARRTIGIAAVDGASQAIAKNQDLYGLMLRGARDAFESHARNFRDAAYAAGRLLQAPPLAMTLGSSSSKTSNYDELLAWIAQYEAFAAVGRAHLQKLADLQSSLIEAKNRVLEWRTVAEPRDNAKEKPRSLESLWLDRVIAELRPPQHEGGGPAPAMDFEEAKFLLRTIGLRFNDVLIAPTPKADQIERNIDAARASLTEQLKQYEVYYHGALQRRTAADQATEAAKLQITHQERALLLQAIVNTPGALNARSAETLVKALLGSAGADPIASVDPKAMGIADAGPAHAADFDGSATSDGASPV